MKPHEKLGLAIADAGYFWTPEMRSAWEELDKEMDKKEMNANELADAMETRASIRRKATSRKSVQEGANDRIADQLEQAAAMLRQQQAEIEVLKDLTIVMQIELDYLRDKAQSNCNGFCGKYECKENKGGCKRNDTAKGGLL